MGSPNSETRRRPRVALYARVSTGDQDPQLQLDELRQVAGQRGWHVVGEFIDKGYSGTKDKRPQLDKLMQAAHRGQLDIVCVWKFDRFARSTRHLVTALEDFRGRNIDFISVRDAIDTTTPTGRFTFSIIAAVAEVERELIRERYPLHGPRMARPRRVAAKYARGEHLAFTPGPRLAAGARLRPQAEHR